MYKDSYMYRNLQITVDVGIYYGSNRFGIVDDPSSMLMGVSLNHNTTQGTRT